MANTLQPDQWERLISPRDGLLDAAIRDFRANAPTRDAVSRLHSLWDTFTSEEFREGLDECCEDDSGFTFPNADSDRLFGNANSRFASGVAVSLLPHLLLGTQLIDELKVWIERAALLAPGQRLGFTADLLSIQWSDNQSERLAQLLAAIPEQAGIDACRLSFHLHHWHNPQELFSNGYKHRLKVPIAAVNADHSQGYILDLFLGWLPRGQPGLIEHPIVWNWPIETDWVKVLNAAYAQQPFSTPVVWGLVPRFDPLSPELGALGGTSHTAATHVGFRVLYEKGDYDVGCLLAADLKSDGYTLEGVAGLDKKCEAALLEAINRTAPVAAINRVVLAQAPTPDRKDISPTVVQKLQSGQERRVTIHWRSTLDKAYEEATGLARGLRIYLTWVRNRMDEDPPAYLGLDRNGERRLLSRYYVDPDILKTNVRFTTDRTSEPPTTQVQIGAATEAEEVTRVRSRQEDVERRFPWKREWPRLFPGSRVAIVGLPGDGKTLLTQMTVRALADQALVELRDQTRAAADTTLPIWLRLRDVVIHGSLANALQHALADALANLLESVRAHLARSLFAEQTWLFLDAFDEVAENCRSDLFAILRRELSHHDDPQVDIPQGTPHPCRVVLTSRPWGFSPERLPFTRLTKYRLATLDVRQRNRFLRFWFAQSKHPDRQSTVKTLIEGTRSLGEVARTPLLLTLTCVLAEDQHLDSSQVRRAILYKLAVRKLLRGETRPELAISAEKAEDQHLLLAEAVWSLFQPDPSANAFTLRAWFDAVVAAGVPRAARADL